jgi:glycosyltransferase involved in cell wall biosynthesis
MNPLHILHTVEFYHPSKGGMQEVVKQISERLTEAGHQVTVATTAMPERTVDELNGVSIIEFDISGNLVKGLRGQTEDYKNFVFHSQVNLIVNFAAQQWATDVLLPHLTMIKAKKIFVPTGFSALHSHTYRDYFQNMRSWMKEYDMNIFHSNTYQDIQFARTHDINNITVIPNAADEREFGSPETNDIRRKYKMNEDHFFILHVGSHTGLKGHREAIQIFNTSKIKNATCMIVGDSLSKRCVRSCRRSELFNRFSASRLCSGKRLITTSFNREETVSAFKQADLFLFPSRVECSPLVLFECMASRTPFLVTDVGNAKEIIEWSPSGVLLPSIKFDTGHVRADIKQSARLLEKLYADPSRRATMADCGFQAWRERFTWDHISKAYESLYQKVVKGDSHHSLSGVE